MRNLKILVQYDGTDYAGFAPQPNAVTIAKKLLAAVYNTTGETVRLTPAGRTDAKVHARGQIVNFQSSTRIPTDRMVCALNTRLPSDIRILSIEDVPMDFHARFDARSKVYVYTIDNSPVPSPLLRRYSAHEPRPLDIQAMQWTADLLQGRHDFRAFCSTGGAARTFVRHLRRLAIWPESRVSAGLADPAPGQLIRILAEADGFLYNMVRIIAGTLMETGLGKRPLADVEAALRTGERRLSGKTAPAHGLCLESVCY